MGSAPVDIFRLIAWLVNAYLLTITTESPRKVGMTRHLVFFLASLVAVFQTSAAYYGTDRLGCYEDSSTRVFPNFQNTHAKNTPQACKNLCQDFKYAGLQVGTECMCGDVLPAKVLSGSRCNWPCPGDTRQTCGGSWALEVFAVEPKPLLAATPMGCFEDNAQRVWKTGRIYIRNISPQRCIDTCRGFLYAGMETGDECYCGNSLPPVKLSQSKCNMPCHGFSGKTCGGPWALEVFKLPDGNSRVSHARCG